MQTIGIHVAVTNPESNHFPWREAIQSYLDFADQVVVVDGNSNDGSAELLREWEQREEKLYVVSLDWPKGKFDYSEFPKHLNPGFEALATDWKIKVDIDYVIHESVFELFRKNLNFCPKNFKAASYGKINVINKDHCYFKVNVPFCIRADSDLIYGKEPGMPSGDWAYPIEWDTKTYENGVPVGKRISLSSVFMTGVSMWNYNYFFRTKQEMMDYFWRYAQSYNQYHKVNFGNTKEQAFTKFLAIETSRMRKSQFFDILLSDHPKLMQHKIADMVPEQYGFNNWGIWDYYHKTK